MNASEINNVSFCKLSGHSKEINCCAFSKKFFVTCSGDKTVRIYSTDGFKEVKYSPLFAHTYGVTYVAFDKEEKYLATASSDGSSKLWTLEDESARMCTVFEHSSSTVVQVCQFSLDNTLFVTGSADGSIAIWDVVSFKQICKIEGHPEGTVTSAAFTPCCDYLVTGSAIGDIRVWTLKFAKLQCVMQTQAHDEGEAGTGVNSICFSPTFHLSDSPNVFNNYLMASCGQDYKTKLWIFSKEKVSQYKAKCLERFTELAGHVGVVSFCCFSNNGAKLATASYDKTVIIWNPLTGEQQIVLRGHTSLVYGVAFSHDDSYLASVSYDKVTFIWKLNEKGSNLGDGKSALKGIDAMTDDMKIAEQKSESNTKSTNQSRKSFTKSDVLEWLRKTINLAQYCDVFEENEIDGDELFALNGDMLANDLGIKPLGHRNKILRGIEELRKNMGENVGSAKTEEKPQGSSVSFKPVEHVPSMDNISKTKAAAENEIPSEYLCPITQEIMKDPVIAADGFTYEKDSIQHWFAKGTGLSPMTNQPFTSNNLTSNLAIKSLVASYTEDNPILKK